MIAAVNIGDQFVIELRVLFESRSMLEGIHCFSEKATKREQKGDKDYAERGGENLFNRSLNFFVLLCDS